jgi:ribosome-associated protein
LDEESTAVLLAAFAAADDKLALDPVMLHMSELLDAFDVLFISAGRTDRQVRAIAEEIERRVALATGLRPLRAEGWETAEWIALDFGFAIFHIFDETAREYYDLEHLWNAAPAWRPSKDPALDVSG